MAVVILVASTGRWEILEAQEGYLPSGKQRQSNDVEHTFGSPTQERFDI
jgi:hypothetical protein